MDTYNSKMMARSSATTGAQATRRDAERRHFTNHGWRGRADYMRAVTDIVDEPEMKSRMLGIAADYDHLAKRAEERLLNAILP
jgi:hypothetical protein